MSFANLLLPAGIAALMVAFTVARKHGLGAYLKPHQYSIALGSAWTACLTLAAFVVDSLASLQVAGDLHSVVWVPTGFLYLSSLISRKEIPAFPVGAAAGAVLLLIGFMQFSGCGSSLASALMGASCVGAVATGVLFRGRAALLLAVWTGCAAACYMIEDLETSQLCYVFFELTALLIVKISVPLFDDDFEDVEKGGVAIWTW